MRLHTKALWIVIVSVVLLGAAVGSSRAADRQQAINLIRLMAHTYWDQKVTIEGHPNGTFFGFSKQTTIIPDDDPRRYGSDASWMSLPHIFMEREETPGHAGMTFAYSYAYSITGDKFLMRCAKALGDTLLQAQADNEGTGWWQDMGVWAYDDVSGSPTQGQRINYGKFVNWVAYSDREAYQTDRQGLASQDGCSALAAYALLKLYQVLPVDDPDRSRYLNGAKAYADAIVGLKDVHETVFGDYYPYGNGGVPQIWPWATMSRINPGYEGTPAHAAEFNLPHNVSITFNDQAFHGAFHFLFEFYQEAKTNAALDETIYRDNLRLHATYLLDVFDSNAQANGRGAWPSFMWVNDGSARANKPTYGRLYEPNAYSAHDGPQDMLVLWYFEETDQALKDRINDTLVKYCLFWKYDVPRLNDPAQPFAAKIESTGSDPCNQYHDVYTTEYDANNPLTWKWWIWVNHESGADNLGWVGATHAAGQELIRYSAPMGTVVAGTGPLESQPIANYYESYPNVRGPANSRQSPGWLIANYLSQDETEILLVANEHNNGFRSRHMMEPEHRFFLNTMLLSSAADQAVTNYNNSPDKPFYNIYSTNIDGTPYTYYRDSDVINIMPQMAYAVLVGTGPITDADGDGVPTGPDPDDNDSEVTSSGGGRPAVSIGGGRSIKIDGLRVVIE